MWVMQQPAIDPGPHIRECMEEDADVMGRKNMSRRKRTRKAGSRNRSTTSSTTGNSSGTGNPRSSDENHPTKPALLNEAQQKAFLETLGRGGSPALAAQKLAVDLEVIRETRHQDEEFARRWKAIEIELSENVAAALYQTALKGTASAQTFYLKQKPPPGWQGADQAEGGTRDEYEEMNDEELLEQSHARGIDPPPEIAGRTESSGDENLTSRLPPDDPD